MRRYLRTSALSALAMLVYACGGEEDPNAVTYCPDYDPTVKYDKPADAAAWELFNTCVPQKIGVPFYHEMNDPIIVKLQESRKFMQLKFSVVTKYDFFAARRIGSHEQSLRAAFNDRMLNVSEEDTKAPDFRSSLATDLTSLASAAIKAVEGDDFPNIVDSVLITSFVIE